MTEGIKTFIYPVKDLAKAKTLYGELEVFDGVDDSQWASPPAFEPGAGELVSRVDDLLAFGQMMLNGGSTGASASCPGGRSS